MSVVTRIKHTGCFDWLGTEQKSNEEDRRQAHYKTEVHRLAKWNFKGGHNHRLY